MLKQAWKWNQKRFQKTMSKTRTPYLLLLPGIAFLFTFFIWPIANLAQTSTQTPIAGGDTGEYEQTLRWRNYIDAFVENKEQFGRSLLYAALATIIALAIAYHWHTRLHLKQAR